MATSGAGGEGVANGCGSDVAELMEAADRALYRAKRQGRDQVARDPGRARQPDQGVRATTS